MSDPCIETSEERGRATDGKAVAVSEAQEQKDCRVPHSCSSSARHCSACTTSEMRTILANV